MKNKQENLYSNDYKKIRFKLTKTNHLLVKASINGVKGNFILDTGASTSCVGLECIELFHLTTSASDTTAAGAGATGMYTQLAKKNKLKIGRWTNMDFDLVVFDLSHVNAALLEHEANAVQGIIGADVLIKGKAIIEYGARRLYLKK